jgi:hypothetical protein
MFPTRLVLDEGVEQIVARERERGSQLDSSGDAFVKSRRRVNSDVGLLFFKLEGCLCASSSSFFQFW